MPLISRNVFLDGEMKLSPWRGLALVAWESVSDASVHAVVEMDAAPMLRYLDNLQQSTGVRVSPVHFVGKAVADTFRHLPDMNCLLRRGRLYRRRDVDIFFPVALDRRGEDLSGVVIRNVDTKPVDVIARELSEAARRLREHGDENFRAVKMHQLRRAMMRFAGFFLYTLNLWTPALGVPRDAFGSAAVTDTSAFGADFIFPPLLPVARLPFVIGVGTLFDRLDSDGKPGTWLRLCIVFDHRIIDGVYGGRICRHLKAIWAEPERHFDEGDTAKSQEHDIGQD